MTGYCGYTLSENKRSTPSPPELQYDDCRRSLQSYSADTLPFSGNSVLIYFVDINVYLAESVYIFSASVIIWSAQVCLLSSIYISVFMLTSML